MRNWNTVMVMPTMYIPEPMAMPMPEVVQRPAAVVKPLMTCLRTKMVPAPRKPMPVMMDAATRERDNQMRAKSGLFQAVFAFNADESTA